MGGCAARGILGEACKSRHTLWGVVPRFLIWDALIIIAVIVIFYWLTRGKRACGESALDVLKRRYAAGEISRKEFLSMRKDLADD